MIVEFPDNCLTESSRWSFSIKLFEVLRVWHNDSCLGMTTGEAKAWRSLNFKAKKRAWKIARNEQVGIAVVGDHWNPRVPDHVSGGSINYPPGLNQANEGSRGIFLIGVYHALINSESPSQADKEAVSEALMQAREDATNGDYWSPKLEDIY